MIKKFSEKKFTNEAEATEYAQVHVDRGHPVSLSRHTEEVIVVRVWTVRTA